MYLIFEMEILVEDSHINEDKKKKKLVKKKRQKANVK
jgi:hypothetical protein